MKSKFFYDYRIAAAGVAGEFAGSIVKSAISGEYSSVGGMVGYAFVEGAWGAAGGALGGLMEGAITPVRVLAEKMGKPLGKVLTKVIRKTVTEIGPSLLGGAISDFSSWYFRKGVEFFVGNVKAVA